MQIVIQTKGFKTVTLKKDVARRLRWCEEHNCCLFCMKPFKEGDRIIRKCHDKCDKINRRGVEKQKWTEDERIAEGYWGPPERTGRPMREPAVFPAEASGT